MNKSDGIPKEIITRLNIKEKEKPIDLEIYPIVEKHQTRLTIPAEIRRELNLKSDQKLKVTFDKKKREIIFKY